MNGLYRLEAFGINSVWVRYRIAHGGLDEPEIEPKRERHRLAVDDFGSLEDRLWATRIFGAHALDDLDPRRPRFDTRHR